MAETKDTYIKQKKIYIKEANREMFVISAWKMP